MADEQMLSELEKTIKQVQRTLVEVDERSQWGLEDTDEVWLIRNLEVSLHSQLDLIAALRKNEGST